MTMQPLTRKRINQITDCRALRSLRIVKVLKKTHFRLVFGFLLHSAVAVSLAALIFPKSVIVGELGWNLSSKRETT